MATIAEMSVEINADTSNFNSGMAESQNRFQAFGKQLSSIGQSLSIGLTAPLVLLGKKIFDVGADYERAMNTFAAVTKASAAEMERAAQVAQRLGADMTLPATSAGDAAKAMTELAKGGFTSAQAMDAARGALQLAAAAQVSEAQAAEITANALNAFGLAATDAGRVADLLASASNASSAEITDIALSLQQASASAAGLKIPIQDLVAGIGEMANAGIKGSDAGTSMKTFLAALIPTTEKASGAMRALGINAFDSAGKFVGLQTIIQQAAPALAKMTDEQQQYAIKVAFGSDAQRAANIILGGGVEKFLQMSEAVGQSGAAQELAAAKTKGLAGAWDGLQSQLETALLKIYDTNKSGLEVLVRNIAKTVEGLGNLSPEVYKAGAAFAAVAGSAGPIALMIGKLAALGPTGVIVGAVIAGAGLMAAAYVTGFGRMDDAIDAFFRNFKTQAEGGQQAFIGLSEVVSSFGLGLVEIFDFALVTIRNVITGITIAVKQYIALMTFQWGDVIQIWRDGQAELEAVNQAYWQRFHLRAQQQGAIWEGGNARLMETIRLQNHKGSVDAANAMLNGFASAQIDAKLTDLGIKAGQDFGNATVVGFTRASVMAKAKAEIESAAGGFKGALRSLGAEAGAAYKLGWDSQTRKSPFFIIHDLMNAANFASTETPKHLSKAGKEIAKAMKKSFQDELGDINTWLSGIGSSTNLSEDIFKHILKNMPAVAAELRKTAKEYDTLSKGIELYAVASGTAAGQNTNFVISVRAAIQALLDNDKALRSNIQAQSNLGSAIGATTIITDKFAEAIRDSVGGLVEQTITAKRAGDVAQQLADNQFKDLLDINDELSRKLPESWNIILDAIVNASGKAGSALLEFSNNLKGWAGDIVGLIDTLPGKFGDAARGVLRTIDQWVQFGDKVLAVLHRLNSNIPASIGGIVEKIAGMFKKSSQAADTWSEDIWTSLEKMSKVGGTAVDGLSEKSEKGGSTMSKAFGTAAAAFQGFITGLSVGSATGSKAIGALVGGVTGALQGFAAGGPIGAVIGGVAGVLGGIFGGGKSSAQKEAERKAVEQAKLDLQRTATDIANSALEGMKKGLEVIEKLHEFADVPKKAITRFLNQLGAILRGFFDIARQFASENLAAAKDFAEGMGAGIDLMSSALGLFNQLNEFKAVPEQAIKDLVVNLKQASDALLIALNELEKGVVKRAGKIADLLMSSFDVLKSGLDVFKLLGEFKPVSDEQLDGVFAALKGAIDRMLALADQFREYALTQTTKIVGKFSVIIAPLKDALDIFKSLADFQPVTDETLNAVTDNFAKILNWMDSLISMGEEGIAKADRLQDVITRLAAALKAAAGAIGTLAAVSGGGLEGARFSRSDGVVSANRFSSAGGGFENARAAAAASAPVIVNVYGHVTDRVDLENIVKRAVVNSRLAGGNY